MTRLASILGVATVATLVLLAGCEQATGKKDTDHVAALAGTWMSAEISRDVPNPMDPTVMIQVTTVVTAMIGVTEASAFTLQMSDTPPVGPPIPTAVTGTFTATADTITVTVTSVTPENYPQAPALKHTPPKFSYTLTETALNLGGPIVAALGLVEAATDQLTLTKQP